MKSFKKNPLSRRAFLRGTGVCMALPLLEAMTPAVNTNAQTGFRPVANSSNIHPRMLCCYIPNGVSESHWVPTDNGPNWTLTHSLEPLANYKSDFTLLSGLGHPNGPGGHQGDHTWLTAADLDGTPGRDYQNSVSIDQIAAELHGRQTRFPSLELSQHGGNTTLAFDRSGTPLPGEQNPRRVFNRLFVAEGAASRAATLQRYEERSSILDVVREQANSLHQRLGAADRQRLQGYLNSVRETELRVERLTRWVNVPRPEVDSAPLRLDSPWFNSHGRPTWLEVMLELCYLAFRTDTTRVITFHWSRESGSLSHNGEDHHALSHHGGDPEILRRLAAIDRFHVSKLAYFLGLLRATREGDGTMLDNTMVLFGSGMSSGRGGGHAHTNLPLLLAGGRGLGLRQGQHLSFEGNSTPMSNLLLTMLQKMGVQQNSFRDSTQTLTGLS